MYGMEHLIAVSLLTFVGSVGPSDSLEDGGSFDPRTVGVLEVLDTAMIDGGPLEEIFEASGRFSTMLDATTTDSGAGGSCCRIGLDDERRTAPFGRVHPLGGIDHASGAARGATLYDAGMGRR